MTVSNSGSGRSVERPAASATSSWTRCPSAGRSAYPFMIVATTWASRRPGWATAASTAVSGLAARNCSSSVNRRLMRSPNR
ncbi:Uncharacterised protein [Mycobacteroides abscessus subsp. abscessus]|nr:Uncharacterised protein [Mycobacteroides abscessus subsp. abscessus]